MNTLQHLDAVPFAPGVQNRCGFSHAVDRKYRGGLIRGCKKRAGCVADMVVKIMELEIGLAEFLAYPRWHGEHGKVIAAELVGSPRNPAFKQSLVLKHRCERVHHAPAQHPRLPVVGNAVYLSERDACFLEAIGDGVMRKADMML